MEGIYSTLNRYIDKNIYPFHMPGHKRNPKFLFFENELINYDITEFGDMDNLHDPQGLIKEMNIRCAKVFDAHESFLMVNGSSGGIIAAIMTVCKDGDKILIARNSHKSVFSGLIYSGAYPKYIYPNVTDIGVVGGVSPNDIKIELEKDENIKAVLITSPTYEGFTSDIRAIAEIVHHHNKILIVDEAHGAHFNFSTSFPETALKQGADIVVQSLHKTLPSFTQTSVLHVQGNLVNKELLANNISMIQTTSPSYMLMASIDICLNFLLNSEHEFNLYVKRLKNFREFISDCKNIELIGEDFKRRYVIQDIDISKLVFHIKKNISAKNIDRDLYENYKIQVELSSNTHILAMTSVADTDYGFKLLAKAIRSLNNRIENEKLKKIMLHEAFKNQTILSPREAMHMSTKRVLLESSHNMISAQFVTPYPPGIPLLVPGELITRDIIKSLQELKTYDEISVVKRLKD